MTTLKNPNCACSARAGRAKKPRAAIAALAAALTAFWPSAQAGPVPPHGITAANIKVEQVGFENDPSNVIVTTPLAIGDFRIRASANRGDYDMQIGDELADDVEGGMLMTSIAENGRDNSDPLYPGVNFATSHFEYSRTGANTGGFYIPVAMTWPNANSTAVIEYNINAAAAWFPYTNWLAGFARNTTGENGGPNNLFTASPGLALGAHFIDQGGGRSVVDLTSLGIDSRTDGVLLVIGAKNEDNYALSQVNTNGTWTVYSKDNGTDGAALEQDPIGFVFIPKTNSVVVSGRILGDASIGLFSGAQPQFSVSLLEPGRYELKIPGRSPKDGVLIISPEGGLAQNRDNIVTYQANEAGDGWVIESRDLPGTLPPLEGFDDPAEPVVSFVFVPGASPGFTVTPSANLFTTEDGGTATFTVTLDTAPEANVTINLASDKAAEGTASPASLVFTPADWNFPQTVTVTGQDDAANDGAIAYRIVLSPAVSTDTDYSGLDPADAQVVNLDNEGGLTVNPTAGLTVAEAGGTASFTVRLNRLPTADVTIALTSANAAEGVVSPASLTFTPADWQFEQTVTITGVDDFVDDGDKAFSIVTAAAVSADAFYSGMAVEDVAVTSIDDDLASIQIAPVRDISLLESGGATNFTVVLTSQPVADVTIRAVSGNTAEGVVNPGTLTFTASNWSAPQSVTISAVDDLVVDGTVAWTVTNSVTSADPIYAAFDPTDVAVLSLDNEAILSLASDTIIYGAGMPAMTIAGQAVIADPHAANLSQAILTVALTANASADDRLEIRGDGDITQAGSVVSYGGVPVANVTGGAGSTPLAATFNENATVEAVQALLRAVTFRSVATNPPASTRALSITFAHADGGASRFAGGIRVGLLRSSEFQEGADRGYGIYTGAADAELYELNADTPYPAGHSATGVWIDWRDADTPNGAHILLRFDNIIGDAPGQIPTNAIIVSADLILQAADSGDGSPLHRMLVAWDAENETWNSIGGGVFPDDVRARLSYDSQIGVENGTGATTTGSIWVSVTPDVEAWVRGQANHGWVMPGWTLNLDGTGFRPSEAANIPERPRLRVKWLPGGAASVASFRQGVNEYASAFDTRIRQNAPDTDFSFAATMFVDALVSAGDPNPEQVLFRFDDIIGSGAGQIPAGSRVEAAILDLASVNGDAMGDGGQFFALLKPWTDVTATWNFWVDGIQKDGIEAAPVSSLDVGNATLNPDVQGGFLSFELTADVQAWVSGAKSNEGWMINPWPNGGNGWGFTTNEAPDERNRPRLRVYYSSNSAPVTVTLSAPVVSASTVQVRFTGAASAAHAVHRAESVLGPWAKIGDATTDASGAGVFNDNAPLPNAAYYRVSAP